MMFFAMFLIVFFIFLFLVGILSLIINVILGIVFGTQGKKKKTYRVLHYVCVGLSIGSIVLMIPFGILMVFVLHRFTVVPDDYIECDIKVTEVTEQGFLTDDGNEYILLPYRGNYLYEEQREAVFSYTPKGLFKKSRWSNIYEITTEENLTFYDWQSKEYVSSYVYVQKEKKEELTEYYSNHYHWQEFGQQALTKELVEIIEKYENMEKGMEIENWAEGKRYQFSAYSDDDLLIINDCWFSVMNGQVYIATDNEYDMYYHYTGFLLEEDEARLVLSELES